MAKQLKYKFCYMVRLDEEINQRIKEQAKAAGIAPAVLIRAIVESSVRGNS